MSKMRYLSGLVSGLLMFLGLTYMAAAQMTPTVVVGDQAIVNGKVTIEKVVSDGPGWIVIHTQKDGKPGPVIGHAPVSAGENTNVVVEIDATRATPTLYAMLHTDAGQLGTYEFPGADVPVKVGDQIVTPAFNVTVGVGVADQAIINGTVTVARVFSASPGWIVIHAQKDGKPGPVLGHGPVSPGMNTNVVVKIDVSGATPVLYAMLHTDAGQAGTYEFPGADVPVKVGNQIITPAFKVTGGKPAMLPKTGGDAIPWAMILLAAGALMTLSGFGLALAGRSR